MDYELELSIVNDMKQQLASFAREIVRALADQRVSPIEGMLLGSKGVQLGMTILNMVQGLTPEQHQNILYVLEHATSTLPPAGRGFAEPHAS